MYALGGQGRKWWMRALVCAAAAVWVVAVAAGLHVLLTYESTPGRRAEAPDSWPSDVRTAEPRGKPALLVFVHPRCPCSRASIGELAKILRSCQGRVDTTVFFYAPRRETAAWATTDLWESAAQIPGVRTVVDFGGVKARSFGAHTSGQAVLYDAGRRLQFAGGITISRGHHGDNDGASAVIAAILGQPHPRHAAPVFGCALFEEE